MLSDNRATGIPPPFYRRAAHYAIHAFSFPLEKAP
jgi:hypothetical protein